MADKKIIEIETKESGSNKIVKAFEEIKKLYKKLLNEEIKRQDSLEDTEKATEKVVENTKKIGEAGSKSAKGVKLLKKGFSALGTALKGLGIGLIISAVALLTETFKKNQKVVDFVTSTIDGITNVFNTVFEAITKVVSSVNESTNGFEGLQKVLGGALTIAFNTIKTNVLGLIAGFKSLKVAYENVFGDEESIKAAQESLKETTEEITKTIASSLEAGKQIGDNIGKAFNEVKGVVTEVSSAVGEIDFKEEFKKGAALQELRNSAKLAEADLKILKETLDRQAEKQRQIRDDESKSIAERKQANDELLKILKEGEKVNVRLAQQSVNAAAQELAINDNIENRIALKNAEAEVEAQRATSTGFISEALVNDIALKKEAVELNDSIAQGENELAISRAKFNAERISDDVKRLEALQDAAELENEIETQRLQNLIDNAKAGTQAKIDAENELAIFKEEKRQEEILRQEEIAIAELEKIASDKELELLRFDEKRALLQEQRDAILADETITADQKKELLEANTNASIELSDKEAEVKKKNLDATANVLSNFSAIAGKETAAGKALSVAAATINTFRGVSDALAAKTVTPFENALKFANAAAIGIAGIANVKKILSVKVPNAGQGGGGASGGASPAAPSFNVIGEQSQPNQINELIGSTNERNDEPVRAYITNDDVNTSTSLNRRIESDANVL